MNQARRREYEKAGYVYILKDDHFKRGVKIGKAMDVEKRMKPMWTANPWLKVFVKIQTTKWEALEKAVHTVIKLVAKRKQVGNSEFFLIEPEKAKKLLMSFEGVIGKSDFKVIEGENKSWKEKCSVKSPRVAKGVAEMTKTSFAKYIARLGGNEGAFGGILQYFRKHHPCAPTSKWRKLLERNGVAFDTKDFVVSIPCKS